MFFKNRKQRQSSPLPQLDSQELLAEIDEFVAGNRASRSTAAEIEIRRLRNLLGMALLQDPPANAEFARAEGELPPIGEQSLVPEVTPEQLTPELLRQAILSNGCLLVRGLFDRDKAEGMAAGIERSLEARSGLRDGDGAGEADGDGYYDELDPVAPFKIVERAWVEEGGGLLAVDSPRLMFDMVESFKQAGLDSVINSYLGEHAAISGQKCTLRKASPEVVGAWHQDGSFLGQVRSLNVWVSLSRCGDVAPSMDIVPRRLEHLVRPGGEGTYLHIQVSQESAEEAAGDLGVVRPIFEPGDALLFDHLFLHATGSDPGMPNPRYAIESWFFAPSAYPEHYVPIAF